MPKYKLTIETDTIEQLRSYIENVDCGNSVNTDSQIETVTPSPVAITVTPGSVPTVEEGIAIAAGVEASIANTFTVPTIENVQRDPAPVAAVDGDSTGMAWDERVHSTPKKTNKDGSFKKKRGIDDATFQAVKAELLRGAPVAPVPVPPVDAVAATADTVAGGVLPAAIEPVPLPVTPVNAAPNTVSTLMLRIQKAFGASKIDQDYLTGLVNRVNAQLGTNYSAPAEFASNQDALDTACNFMTTDGN